MGRQREPIVDLETVCEPGASQPGPHGRSSLNLARGLSRVALAVVIASAIVFGFQADREFESQGVGPAASQTAMNVVVRRGQVADAETMIDDRRDVAGLSESQATSPRVAAIERPAVPVPASAPVLIAAPKLVAETRAQAIGPKPTNVSQLPLPTRNPRFGKILYAQGQHRFTSAPLNEEIVLVRQPALRRSGRLPVRRASVNKRSGANTAPGSWMRPSAFDVPAWAQRAFDVD